jgi:hypothetical protein
LIDHARGLYRYCRTRNPWEGSDYTQAGWWLQNQGIMVASKVVREVVEEIARERAYHPIIDLFEKLGWPSNLIWDGAPRVETWLSEYLGVRDSADARAIGTAWLMSAIARVFDFGCRAPGVMVLGGDRIRAKREVFRILAGDFYASDIETTADALKGVWIAQIDLDEPRSLAEIRALKAFVARRSDRKTKRQCIFGAVIERVAWPERIAGHGWWPVRCGRINLGALERDRDRLIAEALARHSGGEFQQADHITIEGESAIRRYLSERCELHPRYNIEKAILHDDYVQWCEGQGLAADTKLWFGRRLRTALPGRLANYRPDRDDLVGHRPQMYWELRLRQ